MNIYCDIDNVLLDCTRALIDAYNAVVPRHVAEQIVRSKKSWEIISKELDLDDSVHRAKNAEFEKSLSKFPPKVNNGLIDMLLSIAPALTLVTAGSAEATRMKEPYLQRLPQYRLIIASDKRLPCFWRQWSRGIVIDDDRKVLEAAQPFHSVVYTEISP